MASSGKVCNACSVEKPLEDFYKKGKWFENTCKRCRLSARAPFQRELKRRQRQQVIELLGGKCVRCGESDYRYLEIDHVNDDGFKKRPKNIVADIIADRVLSELQLLCGNCHNLKTWHRETYDTVVPKARSKFDVDLSYGREREHKLAEIIQSPTLEIKSDRRAATTGNFFVEIESRGKPSGIMVTKSEYWVQEIAELGVFMMFPTEWFKNLVMVTMTKRGTVRGGDGNTSVGVLVKVTDCVKEIKV